MGDLLEDDLLSEERTTDYPLSNCCRGRTTFRRRREVLGVIVSFGGPSEIGPFQVAALAVVTGNNRCDTLQGYAQCSKNSF